MTTTEEQTIVSRVHECFDKLVDETENPVTIHHKQRNQRLSDLLELFNYLLGADEHDIDKNPIDEWFAIPEDYQD